MNCELLNPTVLTSTAAGSSHSSMARGAIAGSQTASQRLHSLIAQTNI